VVATSTWYAGRLTRGSYPGSLDPRAVVTTLRPCRISHNSWRVLPSRTPALMHDLTRARRGSLLTVDRGSSPQSTCPARRSTSGPSRSASREATGRSCSARRASCFRRLLRPHPRPRPRLMVAASSTKRQAVRSRRPMALRRLRCPLRSTCPRRLRLRLTGHVAIGSASPRSSAPAVRVVTCASTNRMRPGAASHAVAASVP